MATATSASDFVANIGVNTALDFTDTTYANVPLVVAALRYLGVSLVRDHVVGITGVTAAQLAPYTTLAAGGVRFDFIFPNGAQTTASIAAAFTALNAFTKRAPGAIAAIEGPNEVNLQATSYGGKTGIAAGAAEQQAIWADARADPALAGVPVYALTLGGASPAQEASLGSLGACATDGNAHVYPDGGEQPAAWLNQWIARQAAPTGADPMVLTEFGYSTVSKPALDGVPQIVAAKEDLNALFDAWRAGVRTTYLYELMSNPDPGNTDQEAQYGLFNPDGTPKLAATALRTLTALLGGTGTPATPGTLAYTLSGLPATGNTLLLEKGNGAFDIILWNEPTIWNSATQRQITAATAPVTVGLGATYRTVRLYDPLSGTGAVATFANVSRVQVGLTDHPVFLEVSPGTTTGAGGGAAPAGEVPPPLVATSASAAPAGTATSGTLRLLSPSEGVAHIASFLPGRDVIEVARSGFGATVNFVAKAGDRATTPAGVPQVIFDTTTPTLLFDADAAGPAAAQALAVVEAGVTLGASDIVVAPDP